MREGALALYLLLLLTFASHGVWCAAHHHLRLHQHETEGESTQTATQGERTQTARKVGRRQWEEHRWRRRRQGAAQHQERQHCGAAGCGNLCFSACLGSYCPSLGARLVKH